MLNIIDQLSRIGQASLNFFWFPMLIWTALALVVYVCLRIFKNISPMYQYHTRTAILTALPAGLISWSLFNWYLTADAIQSTAAKFIVVMNPITVPIQAAPENSGFSLVSTNTWLGVLFMLLAVTAIYQLIRFFSHFAILHSYKKSMQLGNLKDYPLLSDGNRKILWQIPVSVRLGISEQPQVPSTFGWRKPVIVVPALLCGNPAKLNLAIRHELVHIKQNDYLINTGVQFINRLFRFHPLVWIISKEIHEYSEITCDDEVLSDVSIPVKTYACLLFEMFQLPVLNRRNIVNMANPDSNIKKRITAMTNANRKTKSIRVSFSLFALIMASISMIMACSGLQNQDTSGKNPVNPKFTLTNPEITINGHTYFHVPDSLTMHFGPPENPALGIMFIQTGKFGAFLISGKTFSGAKPSGTVSGNQIKFTINDYNVVITSKSKISPMNNKTLWVENVYLSNLHKGNWIEMGWTKDLDSFNKMVNTPHNASQHWTPFSQMPLWFHPPTNRPPPPIPVVPNKSSSKDFKYLLINGKKSKVYVVADKMPVLIGGLEGIQARLHYPDLARKAEIAGRVYIEFIVDKKGNVVDPKVVRGIGGGCDKEALKIVSNTKFTPGMKDGKPVNILYSLPVVFKLQ